MKDLLFYSVPGLFVVAVGIFQIPLDFDNKKYLNE